MLFNLSEVGSHLVTAICGFFSMWSNILDLRLLNFACCLSETLHNVFVLFHNFVTILLNLIL